MIIDPRRVVSEQWVTLCDESKIQQSGIDVTVKNIESIKGSLLMTGDNFVLGEGVFDFECNEYVKVPQDCVAVLFVRSSFNRKGTFVTTGLYDNGFNNYVGGVLHVAVPITIEKSERIAQIVFVQTEHKSQYNGQYQDRGRNEKTNKDRSKFHGSD